MANPMTVRELHERLARYIEEGNGDAVVYGSIRDFEIDAAMQESGVNWTPADFEMTPAEVTGGGAPMLVIGHVACPEPDAS